MARQVRQSFLLRWVWCRRLDAEIAYAKAVEIARHAAWTLKWEKDVLLLQRAKYFERQGRAAEAKADLDQITEIPLQ
ncbi:MAG TPA: hypothetical protein PLW35_04385 [Verrucomicrobiota bacterium]|nr:hypothetical protein [Verrucomicrobiota bacterium]HOK76944.1 hypothetical protein [Verrucomicrobiota bacterium]